MKLPKADKKTIYLVTWIDAADSESTWLDDKEIKKFSVDHVKVESWGMILRVSEDYVVIAADKTSDKTWGRVTKIPRKWIQNITKI